MTVFTQPSRGFKSVAVGAFWALAVAAGTAVFAVATVHTVQPVRFASIVGVAAMIVGIVVLLLVPTWSLPAIMLGLYALGVFAVVTLPASLPLPPTTLILMLWVIRRLLDSLRQHANGAASVPRIGNSHVGLWSALALGVWVIFTLFAGALGSQGQGWAISFFTAVLVPVCVGFSEREARALKSTWIALGGIIGFYTVIESALRQNFLYWALGMPSSQHWSMYRAEGPFGHPLLLSTFLVVAFGLGVGMWLQYGRKSALVGGALSLTGVVMSLSRGAILAAIVTIFAVYLLAGARSEGRSSKRLVGLGALALAGVVTVVFGTSVVDRWTSTEAAGSTDARDGGFSVALSAAEWGHWLGTGPGTSAVAAQQFGFTLPIENSYLQILVSLGIPGLVVFTLLCVSALSVTIRRIDIAAFGGLVAYLVAIAGYNLIDDRRSAHVLLGCLLIIALNAEWGPRSRAIAHKEVTYAER
ncbi:O-antigen ligase family protein [Agromyces atrinae]|uniref:O-antigen ligase domain-containing protein n=1 Tax=Agromyces atrinae TaxID=592376 RepID=A0A4Q2M2B0_9MICO|nr:O-antigen ligase family protein [Agromyces atrinae]NYD68512.1 hypothetical protein [Agromyces atrinae]RXZ85898.1 O-antigen ligase domain-containing protein [Agromyces atrinae]